MLRTLGEHMFNRYVDGLASMTPDDPDAYLPRARILVEQGYLAPVPRSTFTAD